VKGIQGPEGPCSLRWNGRASREKQVPRVARNDSQKSKSNGNGNSNSNSKGQYGVLRLRLRMTAKNKQRQAKAKTKGRLGATFEGCFEFHFGREFRYKTFAQFICETMKYDQTIGRV
jgi:hypothetical protein